MSGSKFATGRAQFIVYFTKIDLPYPTLIWQPMYTFLKDLEYKSLSLHIESQTDITETVCICLPLSVSQDAVLTYML